MTRRAFNLGLSALSFLLAGWTHGVSTIFLTDDSGNVLTDDSGNPLTAN
jgi:hypothetical protein